MSVSSSLNVLKNLPVNSVKSVKSTCKIWSWTFVSWEFFFNWFNFITGNWSTRIFYFFLIQFLKITFLGIYPFLLGCPFHWNIFVLSNMILCVSVVSFLFYFFAFLILFIWALFFLMSLIKGLSILSFSKNY